MINDAELAELRGESRTAMPDQVTILRNQPTNGPGGQTANWVTVATTIGRLTASVLSGGSEQGGPGQLVSTMQYMLTVPPGTDATARDRVQVGSSTFEVSAVKGEASWNMSDTLTLVKLN